MQSMGHVTTPEQRAQALRYYSRDTDQYNRDMDQFMYGTPTSPNVYLRSAMQSAEAAAHNARRAGLPVNPSSHRAKRT